MPIGMLYVTPEHGARNKQQINHGYEIFRVFDCDWLNWLISTGKRTMGKMGKKKLTSIRNRDDASQSQQLLTSARIVN
jgi:hypothetical protein